MNRTNPTRSHMYPETHSLEKKFLEELETIDALGEVYGYDETDAEAIKLLHTMHFDYENHISPVLPEHALDTISRQPPIRKDLERQLGDGPARDAVRILAKDRQYASIIQEIYITQIRPHITGGNA